MKRWRWLVVVACLLGAIDALAAAEGDEAWRGRLRDIEAPWYDAQRDSLRRVTPDPRQQADPAQSDGNGRSSTDGGSGSDGSGGSGGSSGSSGEGQWVPDTRQDDGWSQQRSRSGGGGWFSGAGTAIAWMLAAVVIAILVFVVLVLVRTILERMGGGSAKPATTQQAQRRVDVAVAALSLDTPIPEGDIERALRQAREARDWRLVIIISFVASLQTLHDHHRIRLRRGTTNRGYLRELDGSETPGSVKRALLGLIDAFERVYFGQRQAVEAMAAESYRAYQSVTRTLDGPQARAR